MTFVDTLAFQLFTLAFVAGLLFYSGLVGYATYRKFGPRRTLEHLKAQAVPLGGIGLIVFSIGLWGELVWPLPGSYNILFFDPYVLLGVVLIGFAVCVSTGRRTQYVGLLAAMTGVLAIYYGSYAKYLALTKEPMAMFLLYVALGLTAVFTFPVTLWIDRMVLDPVSMGTSVEGSTGAVPSAPGATAQGAVGWMSGNVPVTTQTKVLFAGFLLFLLFAAGSAIAALIVGGGALPSHLSYAP